MGAIYGRAYRVVAWLSEIDATLADVLDEAHLAQFNAKLASADGSAYGRFSHLGLPDHNDGIWHTIGGLFRRKWFKRTWIVQEVLLAKEITFLCGRVLVAWDSLVELRLSLMKAGLISLCREGRMDDPEDPDGFSALVFFERARKETPLIGPANIIEVMIHIRLKQVEKPIDKVYGILGLLDDQYRQGTNATIRWKMKNNSGESTLVLRATSSPETGGTCC